MGGADAWRAAKNVLCVRLDTLGDVLMTAPAISALKLGRSGRRVTLLTSAAGAAATQLLPQVDETIIYAAPWLKSTPHRQDGRADHEMVERLRRARFDAAVIFTVYSQNPLPSALLCYLADIPLRLAHCRENPYQLLTDWVREPEPEQFVRHEVRRQLDLVAAVGCTTDDERIVIRVPDGAAERIQGVLGQIGLRSNEPWLVVHAGATAPSRRYPPEAFAATAHQLAQDGWQIVFTGTEPERELVEQVQAGMGGLSYSLAGCLDLGELAALLSAAPLLLSNNTGVVHMAAGLGTPVVDLYALTNPQHTPWAVPNRVLNHDVPCRWCYRSVCPEGHHHCLRLVQPEQVVQAVRSLAEETGRGPGDMR